MECVIWKYRLDNKVSRIEVPKNAQVLSCQMQGFDVCIWFLVDLKERDNYEWRTFLVVETGEPFSDLSSLTYISTVQDKEFARHIFEK